ncbi:MAG: hypothetical protein Q7T32_03900 [Moraxellaceae bacterium]|nr:hypothetical protein [Moraxellaceae bacterium]
MKYLVIVLLLAGGYWLYTEKYNKQTSAGENLVAQIQAGKPVSIPQAKIKADEIVTFFCNDSGLQAAGNSSTTECLGKYSERKERCEQRIFPEAATPIKTEEELKAYFKRFIHCTIES